MEGNLLKECLGVTGAGGDVHAYPAVTIVQFTRRTEDLPAGKAGYAIGTTAGERGCGNNLDNLFAALEVAQTLAEPGASIVIPLTGSGLKGSPELD